MKHHSSFRFPRVNSTAVYAVIKSLLGLFLITAGQMRVVGQENGASDDRLMILPVQIDMSELQSVTTLFADKPQAHFHPVPDMARLEDAKNLVLEPLAADAIAFQDLAIESTDLIGAWGAGTQVDYTPADADLAVSGSYVVEVTNRQFHIYQKSSMTLLITNTFSSLFGLPGVSMFDPKVIYDPWRSRWIMLSLSRIGLESYYHIAVSLTSNPTGSWWLYNVPAHIDASTVTSNWADYPGIGFSSPGTGNGVIVITSNQFAQNDQFQYAKLRILYTSQLYSGTGLNWYDFWAFSDEDGSPVFTWKPAQQWWSTTNSDVYLVNSKNSGGDVVTLWHVNTPLSVTPSLVRQATLPVADYVPPSNCPINTNDWLSTGDCRTQDVVFLNNRLYVAYTIGYDWGVGNNAAVKYCRINVNSNAVERQLIFGASGLWYMYPKVCPEYQPPFSGEYAGISFLRAGPQNHFLEHRVVFDDQSGNLSSVQVVGGTGSLGPGVQSCGDYSGIVPDPSQDGTWWSAGMMSATGWWGSGIGHFSGTPTMSIQPRDVAKREPLTLLPNFPNPFNPSTEIRFTILQDSRVRLSICNTLGQTVETIADTRFFAGTHSVRWNASRYASGMYLYIVEVEGYSKAGKVLLLK